MQDRSTDFEFLPIDVSLGRCQRYFTKITGVQNTIIGSGISGSTSDSVFYIKFPTNMRSAPTATQSTLTISDMANYGPSVTGITDIFAGISCARLKVTHGTAGVVAARTAMLIIDSSTTGFLALDIEL